MSEEREPIRLRDDPSEEPGLRALLDAAQGEHADDAMLERVLAGVLASTGGGGGGGGAPPAKAISTGALLGGGAAAIVAVVIVATLSTRTTLPETQSATVDASIHDTFAVSDTSDAVPDTSDAVSDTHDAVPDTSDLSPSTEAPPASRRPAPTTPPTGEADLPLLRHARSEHDPARSLALAMEHRARFPSSLLAEDREALIIEDLAALGRQAEAERAAETFRARYPASAHLPRIGSALGH